MHALSMDKTSALMARSAPVFPRFYRRFYRFMFQFVLVDRSVPRHFGSLSVLFFFFLSVIYGVWSSGRVDDIAKAAVSSAGFVVDYVDVSGNRRVTEQEILRLLGFDVQRSIVGFDVDEARSILEEQAWIQSADVQKVYPNRVRILIVEREPYAVWQHDGKMDIVDNTGCVIVPFQAEQAGLIQGLPLVVGQGAPDEAKLFIESLSVYPQLRDQIRAYVRVGGRRWDVLLDNGVRIMLPENGAVERIDFLVKAGTLKDLFLRDILSVDLRLSDRVTVALSDDALARHRAAVLEEERMLKALKVGSL